MRSVKRSVGLGWGCHREQRRRMIFLLYLGRFQAFHNGPSVHMTTQGDAVGHIYDLPGVPGVDSLPGRPSPTPAYRHNDYGRPRSRGCVNLKPAGAKFLYRWTCPSVPPGTPYLYRPGDGTRVGVTVASTSRWERTWGNSKGNQKDSRQGRRKEQGLAIGGYTVARVFSDGKPRSLSLAVRPARYPARLAAVSLAW